MATATLEDHIVEALTTLRTARTGGHRELIDAAERRLNRLLDQLAKGPCG